MTRRLGMQAAILLLAAALGAVCGIAAARPAPVPPVLAPLDIGFAQDMSVHHQQAVAMSDMLAAEVSPDIAALAEQIRVTQLTEIGQLTGWLQLVDAPPAAAEPMAWMHPDHPHPMPMPMPGMASPAELTRLQRSRGPDSEVLYLQLMTRHHQGGLDMAAHAARHTTTAAVRVAATVMIDEQSQEVQVMSILLAQRHGQPLPYP